MRADDRRCRRLTHEEAAAIERARTALARECGSVIKARGRRWRDAAAWRLPEVTSLLRRAQEVGTYSRSTALIDIRRGLRGRLEREARGA